ncbi:MAG: T9SS type A sorting domain-containing protein [Salibacteraceae bacterium]
MVSDGICSDSTETTVTVNLLPVINLGPDTSLCQGNALTLDPGPLYPAYAWSTGASTQTISVASVGTYSVTVTDINGCFIADTLSVNAVLPNVQASLGNDTSLCPGDSIVLNPGQNWTSYLWSNGSSGSTLTAANGTYSVTVSATGLCPGSASINLSEYPVLPFSLGNDTTACDSVILDAGNQFAQYAWSSGENSASITATSTNIYTITVTDANGCTQTDQRTVTLTGSPDVDLGFDKLACLEGQGELLNATVPGTGITYLWQDGSTAATFLAQSNVPGIFSYWVQVTEGNGCVDADTVAVEFQTCTSVEEHSKYFSFQAHPNPANEVLYLKSNQQGAATYAMVNLQGQVVQSGNVQLSLQSEALSISSLASGVYFLKVEIEGIFHVQRIVVE